MTDKELIKKYKVGERNFAGADLREADLREASLRWANLRWANLRWADLCGANLCWADLSRADLSEANLRRTDLCGTDLCGANLSEADLSEANLRRADLSGADLSGADLSGANLSGANLSGANLRWANLCEADLDGTCLDSNALIPQMSSKQIVGAGFRLDGDFVFGYHTKGSMVCGNEIYEPGKVYTAPWFSVDQFTDCHPGLYIAPKSWLEQYYPLVPLVYACCRRDQLLKAGDKFRTKTLLILEDVLI